MATSSRVRRVPSETRETRVAAFLWKLAFPPGKRDFCHPFVFLVFFGTCLDFNYCFDAVSIVAKLWWQQCTEISIRSKAMNYFHFSRASCCEGRSTNWLGRSLLKDFAMSAPCSVFQASSLSQTPSKPFVPTPACIIILGRWGIIQFPPVSRFQLFGSGFGGLAFTFSLFNNLRKQ